MANGQTHAKRPIILSLQSIRGIACAVIFICHAGYGASWGLGAWGVSVFFVLSGFVLTYSYWDRISIDHQVNTKESFEFCKKRMGKLFLLHVIMLVIGLV